MATKFRAVVLSVVSIGLLTGAAHAATAKTDTYKIKGKVKLDFSSYVNKITSIAGNATVTVSVVADGKRVASKQVTAKINNIFGLFGGSTVTVTVPEFNASVPHGTSAITIVADGCASMFIDNSRTCKNVSKGVSLGWWVRWISPNVDFGTITVKL